MSALPKKKPTPPQTGSSLESHAILRLNTQLEPGAGGARGLSDAARASLQRTFDKLEAHEETALTGDDATGVHQMRVATRKLRASLQALEGVFTQKSIRRFRRRLRGIAESLGEVRDDDVFLAHIIAYRDTLHAEQQPSLVSLVEAIVADRKRARRRLLKLLKGKSYSKFKESFMAFLTTPGKHELPPPESPLGAGITLRVRDFAGSAIWRRYELWRAHETLLPGASDEQLHQARIAGKRLRYTIELFADALGSGVAQVLEPLVALQDCLGALQDVVTARDHVATLGLAGDPGALEYLGARTVEYDKLRVQLPLLWREVAGASYQRRLYKLIIEM